jgi:zinc-binding alcohol dehydrogenase/oxidoreductase
MRAVRFTAVDQWELAEVTDPAPGPGEVVVDLKAASLNHRDVWIKAGQYAGVKYPCIPGSDGAGVVSRIGKGVAGDCAGSEVIINPSFDWGPNLHAQGDSFSILGLPRDGTLAQKVAVPAGQLSPKPAHLSWEEAAALPLGGLTAWRAVVSRASLTSSDRVLINGVGGGVAVLAMLFAVAHGAETWVTSSSQEKIAQAVKLGAAGGFLYTRKGWGTEAAKASGPFSLVVESAGGPGFGEVLEATAPGGRVVFFGATRGNPPELPMRKIFWRQVSLLGTTMGSPADWQAMIAYVSAHRVRPVVSHALPFGKAAEAFSLMEQGGQFGKIVLRMP